MNDIVAQRLSHINFRLCTVVVHRFAYVVIESFFFVFRYGSRLQSSFDGPFTIL